VRPPLIWLWRLLLGGFVVAYFASGTLQLWVPPLLPFVAAVAVEAQFFVSGLRASGGRSGRGDRGPQARDLADFGYEEELDAEEPGESECADPAPPVPRPRAVRRRLVQVAVVLAVLSALFLLDRSRASWQKLPAHERSATLALLDREAARIAGHPAKVMCDVSGRHVGYVQGSDGLAEVGGTRMWVTAGIC